MSHDSNYTQTLQCLATSSKKHIQLRGTFVKGQGSGERAQYIQIPHLVLQSVLAELNMFEKLHSETKIDTTLHLDSLDKKRFQKKKTHCPARLRLVTSQQRREECYTWSETHFHSYSQTSA